MKSKIYITVICLCLSAMGFAQEADNRANAAVQEEMKIYHASLDLNGEQLYKITQMLGDKIKKKEALSAEITALKKQMDNIDISTDKQIMSVLNEDQQKIMEEKLMEKLNKEREEFKDSLTN